MAAALIEHPLVWQPPERAPGGIDKTKAAPGRREQSQDGRPSGITSAALDLTDRCRSDARALGERALTHSGNVSSETQHCCSLGVQINKLAHA